MSFNVVLMTNASPENFITKETTIVSTLSGTLRGSSSVIDPVIRVIIENPATVSLVNYIEIPAFNRFYFVKDIVSVRNTVWDIYCHVDVLSSWKSYLLATGKGVVKRQEKDYNLYLDDGIFKAYQDPLVQIRVFPSGFTTQEFVLAIAGSDATASDGGSGDSGGTEPGENVML